MGLIYLGARKVSTKISTGPIVYWDSNERSKMFKGDDLPAYIHSVFSNYPSFEAVISGITKKEKTEWDA